MTDHLPFIIAFVAIVLVPVALVILCGWLSRRRDRVDNQVTRAGEALRPFVEAHEKQKLADFKAKVCRDYREWYGRDMPP